MEEDKLRVFEMRVLRRIFGPKRDEVMEGWRKLHNEKLHNLYCSPIVIRTIKSRMMRWAVHVERMGENRNVYRLLSGKKPLGTPRRRCVDNINMDLVEIGSGGVVWLDLAPDRDKWRALVNAVTNRRIP
jgi:hypothetical protein